MSQPKHTHSSSNVFADLGLENADELHLKSSLTILIRRLILERGWTQTHTAEVLGIHQSDVSNLIRGARLRHYSVERLIHFLNQLNYRVTITVEDATADAREDSTSESHGVVIEQIVSQPVGHSKTS